MALMDLDGGKIAYTETGRGETLVLLHCTGGSRAQWQPLAAALQTRFRVAAPDLHGHGDTDPWPGDGPFTLAAEAAIVAALIGARPGPAHLVGHSYGGAVALRAALEAPERVASLTLIEPVAFHLLANDNLADELLLDEIQALAAAIRHALATGDHAGGLERFVDYWNGPGSWACTAPALRRELVARIGAIATNFHATMTEPTPSAAYRRLTMPTLILTGSDTRPPVRRIAELLTEAIPQAVQRVVEGAGHMLPLTHRDAVEAAIAAQLAGATRALPRVA